MILTFRVARRRKTELATFIRTSFLATFLTILGTMIAALPALAEYRQPPNSRIAIDLDEKFVPAPRFSGFVEPETGVSYVMIQMPGATYDELKSMPSHTENLAQRGMTDAKVGTLPGREDEYVYFTATQTQGDVKIAKFILIFFDMGLTGFVTVNVPEVALEARGTRREEVERTLATAKMSDTPGPRERLFELSYLGPFRLAASIAGTAELYNTSGTGPQAGVNTLAKEAAIMVAPSVDQSAIADVEQAAKSRFAGLAGIYDSEIVSEERVTIGGLDGYRITGEAATEKEKPERDIALVFVMLAGKDGGYFILFGTAPLAEQGELLPELEKVIASFRLAG
jgi:hypothetical protein